MPKVPRKVRFKKATSDRKPDAIETRVELEHSGTITFIGVAATGGSDHDVFLAGARAAAHAVEQAGAEGNAHVEVQSIDVVTALAEPVVVVVVIASYRGETRKLYGICALKEDRATAAALAVLNATNRVFELG